MPLCAVIILIKEVTEWCHLISSSCLPCFISLTTVSKHAPRLCSFFYCSSLRHSVIHQQETATTTNLHVWPNDLSTVFIVLSGSLLLWQHGKSLKAGAILTHNLYSRPAIFWIFIKFYIQSIIQLWWSNPRNTLFSLFILLLFFLFQWLVKTGKGGGSHLDGERHFSKCQYLWNAILNLYKWLSSSVLMRLFHIAAQFIYSGDQFIPLPLY